MRSRGLNSLREFANQCRNRPAPEVLHSEEWFDIAMGDATVVGRIDRMDRGADGKVVVTDYKTGKPKSQEDADQSLQLSIYAIAARAKWGYDVDALILYNLEENAPVITRRNHAQLEEARLAVEEVSRGRLPAGDFHAKTGFHCNFCPYHNLCPATEKRLFAVREAKVSQGSKRRGRA